MSRTCLVRKMSLTDNLAPLRSLNVNEARLTVKSLLGEPLAVLWQTDECYECPPITLFTLSPEHLQQSAVISTLYPSKTWLRFGEGWNLPLNCSTTSWQNQAEYFIQVFENTSCQVQEVTPATNEFYPLAGAFLIHVLVLLLVRLAIGIRRKCHTGESIFVSDSETPNSYTSGPRSEGFRGSGRVSSAGSITSMITSPVGQPPSLREPSAAATAAAGGQRRSKSLDAFRGLSLFIMIFVNYGGGQLAVFKHAPWNGLTVADLVFPWFIWIMGVSLAISMRSTRRKGVHSGTVFRKIAWRSTKLFAVGLMLNSTGGNNDISKLRIPGVLQRFAISYFVVATVHLFRATATDATETWRGVPSRLRDVLFYWPEWMVMAAVVAIHIGVTFGLHVPNCPRGYLGPGGLHHGGTYSNCTGGAAGYVDRVVLGENHIYQRNTANKVYKGSEPFDPEGILGCLTSIFLTFLGLQAGKILLTYRTDLHRLTRWLTWGIVCGAAAGGLCGFHKETGLIPINKNLWSLSYVLCMASFAFILLAIMYIAIDVLSIWSGSPFISLGMNSILIYVGHSLVFGMLPWFWNGPETHWRYLLMNLGGTYLWTFIAYILHRNGIYFAL